MNEERLRIYINDQLALVVGEIELAERCRSNNRGGALGEALTRWIEELKEQQDVLQNLLHRLGSAANILKQGMAWLAEKAGRFKINDTFLRYSDLSRLIELEMLAAGACKREMFWDHLREFCQQDSRFADFNFALLRDVTRKQVSDLQSFCRDAARQALLQGSPIT